MSCIFTYKKSTKESTYRRGSARRLLPVWVLSLFPWPKFPSSFDWDIWVSELPFCGIFSAWLRQEKVIVCYYSSCFRSWNWLIGMGWERYQCQRERLCWLHYKRTKRCCLSCICGITTWRTTAFNSWTCWLHRLLVRPPMLKQRLISSACRWWHQLRFLLSINTTMFISVNGKEEIIWIMVHPLVLVIFTLVWEN